MKATGLFLLPTALAALSLIFCVEAAFPDWLVVPVSTPCQLIKSKQGRVLTLTNGIISKSFSTVPGFYSTDFYSHEKRSSILRAINPEAVIEIDGVKYDVGGVKANMSRSFLNRTQLKIEVAPDPNSFQFAGYETSLPVAPYEYESRRGAPNNIDWPPKGLHLKLLFMAPHSSPPSHKDILVIVHYEMYQGVPLLAKWLTLQKRSQLGHTRVGIHQVETLSVNQQWAPNGYNWMTVMTDEPHGNQVRWITEALADLEPGSFQPQLMCSYDRNFSITLHQNEASLISFRVLELVIGSSDPERVGLAKRRVTRLLSPQVMENPIYFHFTLDDSKAFRATVDQLADVGFEMIFYSFGSGFDLESTNATYLESLKADIAYANKKGLEVGGYDLIALSRVVKDEWMAVIPDPFASPSACFASGWYEELLDKVLRMSEYTNLSAIETDGPYGGYECDATGHAYHQNADDSVFRQNQLQGRFFKALRQRRFYINQPDNYFFQGGSKTGMGYNEEQYSLPRWLDLSVSRQGMFDDTFHYIPSQGWMFLPLVVYHSGGADAMFEPLSQHLQEYEFGLAQYLGAGVAACYRGTRVYDTEQTRTVVKKWVAFYKKYRRILSGDLIHVRRPDMQSIDGFLHVNRIEDMAASTIKGLAFFFNPTLQLLKDVIEIPLYYSGLNETANLMWQDQPNTTRIFHLSRDYSIQVPLEIPARSFTWLTIRA